MISLSSYDTREKQAIKGLKISNWMKTSKSANQPKTPVLTYLKSCTCPGFAFILNLLHAPLCLLLAPWKSVRQHDTISAFFIFSKFRSSDFSTFLTQIGLNFLISKEIYLHFFIFWKLSEKGLLCRKFFQCFWYKYRTMFLLITTWKWQSLILHLV